MSSDSDIRQYLRNIYIPGTLILCVGNDLKGDDGVGPFIFELLEGKLLSPVINAGTVPENYIRKIINLKPNRILIVDAVSFQAEPGTVRIFKPEDLDSYSISTHVLSPRLFVNMIKREWQVDFYVIGIQPEKVRLCRQLSQTVSDAARWLSNEIIEINRAG